MYFKRGPYKFVLVFFLFISCALFVSAASLSDVNVSNFNNGTYSRTFYNTTGNFVQLNASQGFYNGTFTSRIFDAGAAVWGNITWTQGGPYGQALPNDRVTESQWLTGNANMTGNILLLHFDEASGTGFSDSSGIGHVVTAQAVTYGSAGIFGSAFLFSPNVSNVSVPFASVLNPRGNLSYEAWINWKGDAFQDFDLQNIITNGDPDRALRITEPGHFSGASGGKALFYIRVGGSLKQVYSNINLTNNTWYYLAATYNGTGVSLYINGRLDNSASASGQVVTGTDNTYIGYEGVVGHFNGTIDEVAIYNRSLNSSEILDRYKRGALRLNFTVRSCDDSVCAGDSFSDIVDSPPQNLSVTQNRYFQYAVNFTTLNLTYTPELYNVSVGYVFTNVAPQLTLVYPIANSNYSNSSLGLNYTVYDANSNLASCWYSINSGVTNTSITCGANASLVASQGNLTWTIYANDSLGQLNSSSVSFFVDSIAPAISVVYPTNKSNFSSASIGVNYTVSDSYLNACWWTKNAGVTNVSLSCGTNISSSFSEGSNNVIVYSNDSLNNVNSSSVTFLVDTTAPSVSLYQPSEGQTFSSNLSLVLGFSVSDAGVGRQACWYTLTDGSVNFSLPNCQNTTFNVSGSGHYTVRLYSNDSLGNVGYSSHSFGVNLGAPAIQLLRPSNATYSPNASMSFVFNASDLDLEACELWGDFSGAFALNQTNYTMNSSSGQQTSFALGLANGTYIWGIHCNDSAGNYASSGNLTLFVDPYAPVISLTAPSGTYTSLIGIPLSYQISDQSPVSCSYNVSLVGVSAASDIALANCSSTSFDVGAFGNYVLYLSANDSAGNRTISSASFSVTQPSTTQSSSGGGGGGGGHDDSGSSFVPAFSGVSMPDVHLRAGFSQDYKITLVNRGATFLNGCSIKAQGPKDSWVSSSDVHSLGSGEESSYSLHVNVPRDASPGSNVIPLSVSCDGAASTTLSLEVNVIRAAFAFDILSYARVGTQLVVNYSIEDLTGSDSSVSLDYVLVNSESTTVTGGHEVISLRSGAKEIKSLAFELPKDSVGEFNLLLTLSTPDDHISVKHPVFLSGFGATGLAISSANKATLSRWGIILVIVGALGGLVYFLRRRYLITHPYKKRLAGK